MNGIWPLKLNIYLNFDNKMLDNLLGLRYWALKRKFNSKYHGPFSELNSDGYFIAIISRGEQLLYEDLIGEVRCSLFLNSKSIDIRHMSVDGNRKLLILKRISAYFESYQGYKIELIEY